MASPKKAASSKRTNPPRASDYAKQFLKDWERLTHSGRYNMRQLQEAMLLLIANDGPLAEEWLDHEPTGEWSDHRECHIGGDFLLIYRVDGVGPKASVIFVRAGTHTELFK
jgi:mRNA interferase YafQ